MSDRFSSDYKITDPRTYGPAIAQAFQELASLSADAVVALTIPDPRCEGLVVACLPLSVRLPSRGPVSGVDIRAQEPILLVFDTHCYPYRSPWVWSDRRDFPSDRLPHLNPVPAGWPASLCLYRGDIDSWFADKSLADFVSRARRWLRDAAMNRLIPPGDGFEPTRMTDATGGYCIFDPDLLTGTIYQHWKQTIGSAGFVPLLMRLHVGGVATLTSGRGIAVRVVDMVGNPDSVRERLEGRRDLLIGMLAWPARNSVCSQYFGFLPHRYDELLRFADTVGLELEEPLASCQRIGPPDAPFMPTILAVQRPERLLGGTSRLEMLSFLLLPKVTIGTHGFTHSGFEERVFPLANRIPLTSRRAAALSDIPAYRAKGPVVMIGCGAVGSKVTLHIARAGWDRFLLVDHDTVSPHNMARHGLLGCSVGRNKAEALAEAVRSLYAGVDHQVGIETHPHRCFGLLQGEDRTRLKGASILLDASASRAVLRALVDADLGDRLLVARCEVADSGRLGLFFVEGADRNPRLDDLRALLFDYALEDEPLSDWLQRSRPSADSEFEHGEVRIGVGCSSDTMLLGDGAVSYHASLFARALQDLLTRSTARPAGRVLITVLPDDLADSVGTKILSFEPMKVLSATNAPGWKVRLSRAAISAIVKAVERAAPNETGGLLIGRTDPRSRTICVTRTLPPPPDSIEAPYAFKRGVKDAPESILHLHARTGGQLCYVGEWHSHLNGLLTLSEQDKQAARQIHRHLSRAHLPTHLLIATRKGLASYVFEPDASVE